MHIPTAFPSTDSECPLLSTTLFEHFTAEWNASNVVKANSMPDILLRAGRVIAPITISKSQAAKQSQPEGAAPEKKKMQRTITGNKKHKK